LSVTGGFSSDDTLQSVLEFVKCYYAVDRTETICLRLPHLTKAFGNEEMLRNLKELDLVPRSILIASTLTDGQLVEQMKEVKYKTSEEVRKNVVNADIIKREKMKKVEMDKDQKKKMLQAFNDDRDDFKERRR
jgi:hypothetical protein